MNRTGIAWTNETWNVFSGCAKVSPGCNFCFAKTIAERHRGDKAFPDGFELTIREHRLEDPLKIKEPRLIFVNSMSDFFLEEVPDELRDRMVDMMERTPQHQYQILTKRPSEMLRYAKRRRFPSNCWLGVSVESQNFVNRIDLLREVDVGIRFLSCEPLLGPLNLNLAQINWVIVGGESGSHLSKPEIRAKRSLVDYDAKTKQWTPRPDRYHLVTSIRDQCIDAKVPFFFKQWGGFKPDSGGNLLDGRVWEEYPRLPEQEQLTNDGGIMTALNHPKILDGINITPMTAQEARECVTAIIGNLESLGAMLLDLDRRRGWEALGYCSFRECAMAEFGKSQGYVYKLLHAAEVDENLAASEIYPLDKSEIAKIATSHKEELHKLPPNQQALALKRADELAYAEGKPREVRHVAAVVKEYKSVEKETEAKGESLGLPARGDSTLSETDRIDKLTHTSPMDVDDRPFVAHSAEVPSKITTPLTRVENDFYPTRSRLTEILLEEVDIKGRVVEPCAGDGAIAKLIPGCLTNDFYPHPEYVCNHNLDATLQESWEKLAQFDWAVTNPPFGLAPLIIPLAFEYARVGIAMLLRLSYLEPCMERNSARGEWLESNADHLSRLIVFNPRPKFRNDTSGQDNVTIAWFVWRKDWSWQKFGIQCPFKFAYGWKDVN